VTEPGLTYPGIPPQDFHVLPFGNAVPRGVISYQPAFNIDAGRWSGANFFTVGGRPRA
jgi:hypothetical protein